MSSLDSISVSVQYQPTSMARAIVNEIDAGLKTLIEQQRSSTIDLRGLPLFPGDAEYLKSLLGIGEINIALDALGPSEIYETAIPGVWWCTHYNEAQEIIAEQIEITTVPALVQTDIMSLQQARKLLAKQCGNDGIQ